MNNQEQKTETKDNGKWWILGGILIGIIFAGFLIQQGLETDTNIPQNQPEKKTPQIPKIPDKQKAPEKKTISIAERNAPNHQVIEMKDSMWGFEVSGKEAEVLSSRNSRPYLTLSPSDMKLQEKEPMYLTNRLKRPEMLLFYKASEYNTDYSMAFLQSPEGMRQNWKLEYRVHLKSGETESIRIDKGLYKVQCLMQGCKNTPLLRVDASTAVLDTA